MASWYLSSDKSWPRVSAVSLGSTTIYESKYSTFSMFFNVISRRLPILLGRLLRNQMWETGVASSICPNAFTSHFGLDYFDTTLLTDHATMLHALVFYHNCIRNPWSGPKILAQNKPSRSGFKSPVIDGFPAFLSHRGTTAESGQKMQARPLTPVYRRGSVGLEEKIIQCFHKFFL